MKNSQSLRFFRNLAFSDNNNAQSVKLAHNTDYTNIDAKFILKYTNNSSSVLDIGSGTGLIINKLYDKVQSIECIEPFKQFSDFIIRSKNIIINNCNIFDYKTDKIFDIITIFGVMTYFSEDEAIQIYLKCYNLLKTGGIIIIKNQFGINETVNVSGYSEENEADYYAQYRHINKEINILKNTGFKNVEKYDIYPQEANRWNNTHFYALIAVKL